MENELQENPYAGKLVAGTGGVRKIRVGREGGGKRGGARVLYYFVDPRSTVYLMLAYAKNDQSDLDPAQKRLLRGLVESIEEEE